MPMLSKKLILAPLRGITNHHFRTLFQKHFGGFDLAMAPFVPTVQAQKFNENLFRDIIPAKNNTLAVIPQLLGNNPDDFLRMAAHIHQRYGFSEINWNLGCPVGTVTRKKKGSGLLQYPELIYSFLDSVMHRRPCDISIKIRLGYDRPDRLTAMMEKLNNYPICCLTVHARTAAQMYEGSVDLDHFAQVYDAARMPVWYNGDITSKAAFSALSERFPNVSGWMIGRGAISDPFLPQKIKGTTEDDPIQRICFFHEELFEIYRQHYYGPAPLLGAMKEIWNHLHQFFQNGGKMLKAVRKTKTPDHYLAEVKSLLNSSVPAEHQRL
ncbi:MAG: tRNA dihydrouridine synthase [Chitinispirillaceae bacterium]